MADVRNVLLELATGRGESLAALSRMLRRNDAYLQQFVRRGSPRHLEDADRRVLADHFGVEEALLGGPAASTMVAVPYLSARASAGRGITADERLIRTEPFAPEVLRRAGVSPADASMITADGESMRPTILSGDRLVVDRADRSVRRDTIFVLRVGEELRVKRLVRDGTWLALLSDNDAYPPERVAIGDVEVIGAVKLLLRGL